MTLSFRRAAALAALLMLDCVGAFGADGMGTQANCGGAFRGKTLSAAEIDAELSSHDAWLQRKPNAHAANFCGADLSGVQLVGKNLRQASFNGAKLINARLDDSDLSDADFTDANLNQASLRATEITRTRLANAEMYLTDLKDAVFEPIPGSLPAIYTLSTAKGLESIKWRMSSHAMFELKDSLRKAGLRDREREVLYAIKRREMQDRNAADRWFNFVLFDLTSQYGMSTGRPLWLLLGLGFVLSFVYMRALFLNGDTGIWAVWMPDRVLRNDSESRPARVTADYPFSDSPLSGTPQGYVLKMIRAWWIGAYFSALSAFHLGWRDLNIGNWLTRLQPREYILRGTGWVRVIAGVQSIVSVYLLALWALTYFGRPFD